MPSIGEKKVIFTLDKIAFLCFLYAEPAGLSEGHFLSYLKLRCIAIFLRFCSCYFFSSLKILIKKFFSFLARCSKGDCLLPGFFLSFHIASFGALSVYLDLALICSFLRVPGWNMCCQAQPWWKSPRSLHAQQPQCCC